MIGLSCSESHRLVFTLRPSASMTAATYSASRTTISIPAFTPMRYRLRTLMIVLALGPPLLALAWFAPQKVLERYRQWQFDQLVYLIQTTVRGDTGDLVDTSTANDPQPIE